MLLSAAWAAGLTAIVLDPGLLSADAEPADVQLGALRDEIAALRADLAVARARPAATQDIAPADATTAAAASPLGLPRAAGAPPAAETGLGAERGPPEGPTGLPAGFEEPPTYRLTQGEGLFQVAERFGTTVEALAAANGIVDVDNVPVGMLLVLP